MEILQMQDLTFRYPQANQDALTKVSLTVAPGEFLCLCGPSGCGKSTLLKLIKKELSPYGEQAGEITYNGRALRDLDARTAASDIGFVLQDPESQIVTDSVWHELAFGLESLGYDPPLIRRRVAEMASYFGIEDWFHKKTAELSGGQKQLLNLASVMVMNPKLLLLDEPTAQLDPIAAANFIGTLQKLNRELGLTILLVEHRLEEVFPIADRVILMESGCIVYADAPGGMTAYFKAHPTQPMTAGLPAAMRIFALLGEEGDAPVTVRDGRKYVTETYENQVNTVQRPPYRHSPQPAVELKEVWFRYAKELPDVLQGTSLTVYKGEHFCILGGNGAGKSTALHVIAGLLQPYRGKITVNGQKLSHYQGNTLYLRTLALLPQNPQTVFLEKTVGLDLSETCQRMQYTPEQSRQKISAICERLGIGHLLECHPYDISGGEQQKAALAKMLLLEPKLLLLDEPTKGIDPHSKKTLQAILQELKRDGITVITVTHDVEFAASVADRCGLFFDGGLVSAEAPWDFFAENSFYTTAANRISRGHFKNAVLCEEVAALCRLNPKKAGGTDA